MRRWVSVAVVVVMIAFCAGVLTEAVGRTRQAAARTQCQNNLKQLGLGLHSYQDALRRFPAATVFRETPLPPERRLSWQFDLIPYMESIMDPEWGKLYGEAWDTPDATSLARYYHFAFFLCPANPDQGARDGPGLTHYIGFSGVGKDAIHLPLEDPRAGLFGYARKVTLADIKDGLSNTVFVAETARANGPWAAPGYPTVRGLDTSDLPYLGEEGQFNSLHRYSSGWALSPPLVTHVLRGDGSVLPLTDAVSPQALETLVTIAGGERLDRVDGD